MLEDPRVSSVTAANTATSANVLAGTGFATYSFVCTGRGPTSSTYRYTVSSSHYIDLTVSRQVGKRTRATVRLTESELVADPINSELNSVKTSTIYIVADVGPLGTGTNWDKMSNILALDFLMKGFDFTADMTTRVLAGET